MTTLDDRKAELDATVKGFFVPIFEEDDLGSGHRLAALREEDFLKVAQGYGCGKCLAEFVTYMAVCPVCRHERNVEEDIQGTPPEIWVEHLKRRALIESGEIVAPAMIPGGIDELMEELKNDPNVETIPLRKL